MMLYYDVMPVHSGEILLHGSSGCTSTPRHISKQIYSMGLIPSLGTLAIPLLCEGDR